MKNWTLSLLLVLAMAGSLPARADSAPGMAMARGDSAVELGHAVHFTVDGLACGADAQKMQLWLDGMDTGLRSIGCDVEGRLLTFDVTRNGKVHSAQTDEAWNVLLRDPFRTDREFMRDARLTVVADDGQPVASIDGHLRLLDGERIWTGLLLLGFGLVMLWYGALRTGMLRDSGAVAPGARRTYSLSRVQMVWWFAIVFFSYVLLWLVLQDLPTIPTTVLGLIGIAGGTALTAAAIDSDKGASGSQGFWHDISTDLHGATLSRIQQIVWTVMFGFVFIAKVLHGLAMPDFDSSVLVLMGISSGTYLGFKVPENQRLAAANKKSAAPAPAGSPPAGSPPAASPPAGSPPH